MEKTMCTFKERLEIIIIIINNKDSYFKPGVQNTLSQKGCTKKWTFLMNVW